MHKFKFNTMCMCAYLVAWSSTCSAWMLRFVTWDRSTHGMAILAQQTENFTPLECLKGGVHQNIVIRCHNVDKVIVISNKCTHIKSLIYWQSMPSGWFLLIGSPMYLCSTTLRNKYCLLCAILLRCQIDFNWCFYLIWQQNSY